MVKVWPALIVIGESVAPAPEGWVSQWTLCGAPDWLSWSTKLIVLLTPTTTVMLAGWKLSDWSAPTFCGITTVTAAELEEPDDDADEDEEEEDDVLLAVIVDDDTVAVVLELVELDDRLEDEIVMLLLLLEVVDELTLAVVFEPEEDVDAVVFVSVLEAVVLVDEEIEVIGEEDAEDELKPDEDDDIVVLVALVVGTLTDVVVLAVDGVLVVVGVVVGRVARYAATPAIMIMTITMTAMAAPEMAVCCWVLLSSFICF
jgi:hypothetical protein